MPSLHCCDCQLLISSHHSLCLAVSRGSHALLQSTQYRSHHRWTRFRSAAQQQKGVSTKTVSVHALRDALIVRHEPCGLTRESHVHLAVDRSHSKLALIASNTAHAIDQPQLPQARLLRRRQGMLEENASTLLDLQSCWTACKLQMTFALLPQFRQFVWLGVLQSREIGTLDSKIEQMWFLVTQPFLSFDLVSLPQVPHQSQIHCFGSCAQLSECPLSRFPEAKNRHPKHPSVSQQPC